MTPVLWFIVLAASGFGILTLWVVVKASRSMKGSGSGKKKPKKPGLTIDEVAKFHGAFMLGFFGIWMWPVKWFVEQLFTEWLPLQEEFMNTVLIADLVFSPE